MTDKTIMISRADGGRNEGNPAGGRDHAPSRGRNRSGPVAGGGLSLRPPHLARVVPGRRPVISPALDQVGRRLCACAVARLISANKVSAGADPEWTFTGSALLLANPFGWRLGDALEPGARDHSRGDAVMGPERDDHPIVTTQLRKRAGWVRVSPSAQCSRLSPRTVTKHK
jgi:hypothetical protein